MKSYLKCSKVSAFKSYLGLCSKGLENWKNYIHINGVIVLKFYMEPGQLGLSFNLPMLQFATRSTEKHT